MLASGAMGGQYGGRRPNKFSRRKIIYDQNLPPIRKVSILACLSMDKTEWSNALYR